MSSLDFNQLPLKPALVNNLKDLGFENMTSVQADSLPHILQGSDVLAKAKTGSGKTVAFSLGLLSNLSPERFRVQALVLCPTRELAEQVAQEIRRLARLIHNVKVLTLCGGTPMGPQIASLAHGAHIIVATPGRIVDHVQKRRLDLSHLNTLVFDEADRMLDMGFEDEINALMLEIPMQRQTLLFSATYPSKVDDMMRGILRNPVTIEAAEVDASANIQQVCYKITSPHRDKALAAVLTHYQPSTAIVFCNTRVSCHEVVESLVDMGFSAVSLNGDMEQRERQQVLYRFANQSAAILVATDVAARGLDIKGVDLVVSYELCFEPDVHVHRIGRTGRADETGVAVSLCAPEDEIRLLAIEQYGNKDLKKVGIESLRFHANRIVEAPYQTIVIDGGKKAKVRPGDILGALTKDAQIDGVDIGKINITATHTYVAIKLRSVKRTLNYLRDGKIKGRKIKARKLS